MIEEVTGKSFEDYARERILKPLGMKSADYHLSEKMLANASNAHDMFGEEIPYIRFTAQAAAGLQTTIHDLGIFAAATVKGPNGEPPGRGVLKPETIAMMLEPTLDGKSPTGLGYFAPKRNIKVVGHGGDNSGWHANFNVAVNERVGMVILTNADGGSVLRDRFTCEWFETIGVEGRGPCKSYSFGLIINRLQEHGVIDFKTWYNEIEKSQGDEYIFHEMIINQVGFEFINKEKYEQAITLFQFNTEKYPESFNTWDSLGYAYMKMDKIQPAIDNYRKSIELNPNNEEGKMYLKELLEKAK